MNAEDADAVGLLEVAAHLGYLGYKVTPPADDDSWCVASHPERWRFVFRRWRSFVFLRCVVQLTEADTANRWHVLEWVNALRLKAKLTCFHAGRDGEEQAYVEATAVLQVGCDRAAFGAWMLTWVEEISRITLPIPRQSESDAYACD